MEREKLGSRLGFILLSAGCAIGCGNVCPFSTDVRSALHYLLRQLQPGHG